MKQKSYYDILGVPKTASEAEIKSAYRKLALKWHPDKWASKSESEKKIAESHMKEVNRAYGILSDAEKRKYYDLYGTTNFSSQTVPQIWQPSSYFVTISFLVSLPLTIFWYLITWLFDIEKLKKILYFWLKPYRYRDRHDWILPFVFTFLIVYHTSILIYVFYFLGKSWLRWKRTSYKKAAIIKKKKVKFIYYPSKYLFFLTVNQTLLSCLFFLFFSEKNKTWFLGLFFLAQLLIILNTYFFIHYFFSRPVTRFLQQKYPKYFPKYFAIEYQTHYYVRYWGYVKMKKPRWNKSSWSSMISLSFFCLQTLGLLAIILLRK